MPVHKKIKRDEDHCCPKEAVCPVCRTAAWEILYGDVRELDCTLNDKSAKATIDSASQIAVITTGMLVKLGLRPKMKSATHVVRTFCGGRYKTVGVFEALMELGGKSFMQDIIVLLRDTERLVLGINFSGKEKLVKDYFRKKVWFKDECVESDTDEEEDRNTPSPKKQSLESSTSRPILTSPRLATPDYSPRTPSPSSPHYEPPYPGYSPPSPQFSPTTPGYD